MNDKQIDIFLQVADCGSFAKASENLFLSNVSIMNQINSLEDEAEVKLFNRTSKGCTLTKAGQSLYKDLKVIRDNMNAALERARNAEKPRKKTIRVGSTLLFSCNPLFEYLTKIGFESDAFSIEIIPFTYEGTDLLDMLPKLEDKIDMIVGANGSNKINEISSFFKLMDTEKVFAVPVNHRLAKKDRLSLQDLRGETVVMVGGNDSPVNYSVRQLLQQYPDITIKDAPFVYDISVYNYSAQHGYILSTLDLWRDVHPNMKNIPVDFGKKVTIPVGIITAKEPSDRIKSFLKSIKLID